jgi:drug/metabolite transporter (DMT)-like permease
VALFGDTFSAVQAVGGVLILGAVITVQSRGGRGERTGLGEVPAPP